MTAQTEEQFKHLLLERRNSRLCELNKALDLTALQVAEDPSLLIKSTNHTDR